MRTLIAKVVARIVLRTSRRLWDRQVRRQIARADRTIEHLRARISAARTGDKPPYELDLSGDPPAPASSDRSR